MFECFDMCVVDDATHNHEMHSVRDACVRIEDSSRNRCASTAYFAKPGYVASMRKKRAYKATVRRRRQEPRWQKPRLGLLSPGLPSPPWICSVFTAIKRNDYKFCTSLSFVNQHDLYPGQANIYFIHDITRDIILCMILFEIWYYSRKISRMCCLIRR